MTGLKELVRRFTVVAIATTAAVLGLTPAVPASASTPTVPSGTYLGAYVQPDGWSQNEVMASITDLEADLGRTLDISHLFYTWNGNFPNWKESWDIQNGRIPMISWRGTALDPILNGSQDALIQSKADGLKALGSRVLLRWFGEMDAVVWEDEIGTPSRFVQAWQRIHDIFESRGATNVEWVWCPNASAFGSGRAQTYYPGAEYVDWICGDGYNWAPGRPGSSWTPFQNVFASFYAWGSATGKPLLIGETGALERNAGEKGSWIAGMADTIKSTYPAIKALVYFDAAAGSNQGGWYDWRVDTSPASYNAFRAMAADPYFNSAGGGESDTTPPTVPQSLQGAAPDGTRIDLQWSPSTDNVGLAGYDVVRNGTVVASVEQTTFVDTTVSPGVTYEYTVRARDLAGNVSAGSTPVSVTTPSGSPTVIFSDTFESGTLSQWTTSGGIAVNGQMGFNGTKGVRAQGTGSPAYALRGLGTARAEVYDGFRFKIASQGASSLYLARMRTATGTPLASLYVRGNGKLSVLVDAAGGTTKISPVVVSKNVWHTAQLHVRVAGSSSVIEVWLDGTKVAALTSTANLGSNPIAQVQMGENVSGRSFDVRFDDVAVSTAYLPV